MKTEERRDDAPSTRPPGAERARHRRTWRVVQNRRRDPAVVDADPGASAGGIDRIRDRATRDSMRRWRERVGPGVPLIAVAHEPESTVTARDYRDSAHRRDLTATAASRARSQDAWEHPDPAGAAATRSWTGGGRCG